MISNNTTTINRARYFRPHIFCDRSVSYFPCAYNLWRNQSIGNATRILILSHTLMWRGQMKRRMSTFTQTALINHVTNGGLEIITWPKIHLIGPDTLVGDGPWPRTRWLGSCSARVKLSHEDETQQRNKTPSTYWKYHHSHSYATKGVCWYAMKWSYKHICFCDVEGQFKRSSLDTLLLRNMRPSSHLIKIASMERKYLIYI